MPNLCKISCESGSKAGLLITSMQHFFLGSSSLTIRGENPTKTNKNKQKTSSKQEQQNQIKHMHLKGKTFVLFLDDLIIL